MLDGTIDAIATDHARIIKTRSSWSLRSHFRGYQGLKRHSLRTHLTKDADLIARLMSVNPARIIGKPGGVIKEGMPADLTVADMDAEYTLTEKSLASKGKNTPFIEQKLHGVVIQTFVDGQTVFDGGDSCA